MHDQNIWSPTQKSGDASSVKHTRCVRAQLVRVVEWISRNKVPRTQPLFILDAPCGDLVWMPTFWREYREATGDTRLIVYHGIDIVPQLVRKHAASADMRRRARESNVQASFTHHDIVSEPLPPHFGGFDLILSKDVFIHLTNDDGLAALEHLRLTGSHLLLATSNPLARSNRNLEGKEYSIQGADHEVNLLKPPFSLPEPICSSMQLHESGAELSLWDLSALQPRRGLSFG